MLLKRIKNWTVFVLIFKTFASYLSESLIPEKTRRGNYVAQFWLNLKRVTHHDSVAVTPQNCENEKISVPLRELDGGKEFVISAVAGLGEGIRGLRPHITLGSQPLKW